MNYNRLETSLIDVIKEEQAKPVSYTHLDVYKRQEKLLICTR